jgi:hypothetical protein
VISRIHLQKIALPQSVAPSYNRHFSGGFSIEVELMQLIDSALRDGSKSTGRRDSATPRSKVTDIRRLAGQCPLLDQALFYGIYFSSRKTQRDDQLCCQLVRRLRVDT